MLSWSICAQLNFYFSICAQLNFYFFLTFFFFNYIVYCITSLSHRHSVCIVPFVWRGLQNSPGYTQELQCVPRDVHEVHGVPFFISVSKSLTKHDQRYLTNKRGDRGIYSHFLDHERATRTPGVKIIM